MLEIDRLNIQLPAGMESRAASIVRRLARDLSRGSLPESGTIDRVDAGPVAVSPGLSQEVVARRIAEFVRTAVAAAAPGGIGPTRTGGRP